MFTKPPLSAALFRKYLFREVGTVATNDIYGKELADMFENEVTGMADVPVSVVSRQRFDVMARAATVRSKIQQVISVVVLKLLHVVNATSTSSPM